MSHVSSFELPNDRFYVDGLFLMVEQTAFELPTEQTHVACLLAGRICVRPGAGNQNILNIEFKDVL